MADDSFLSFSTSELDENQSVTKKREPFVGTEDFLLRHGFAKHVEAFKANNISSRENLLNLRFGSLSQLGITVFSEQKRLWQSIEEEQRFAYNEMKRSFERQKMKQESFRGNRPGTAPHMTGSTRFGGFTVEDDYQLPERRPHTAVGVFVRTASPERKTSSTKAWLRGSMQMRIKPSRRRLEAPNATTSKAERLRVQRRFMSESTRSLEKMRVQTNDLKKERLLKLRSQKIDLKAHIRGASVNPNQADANQSSDLEKEREMREKKGKKGGKGSAPNAKQMREAKIAYARHQMRVTLANMTSSLATRQARLDEYCQTIYKKFPAVAKEATELRKKQWKPIRKR